MIYYVDTSSLVKRCLYQTGSQWIRQLFLGVTNARQVCIVTVTGVEMTSALSRKVRLGDISQSVYQSAMHQFEGDFPYRYTRIRVTYPVIALAMELATQYPLRGYDAIQLAAALELRGRLQSISSINFTLLSTDDDREFADPRFIHLWDRHRATGRLWQLVLGKRNIPWDIYFLYDANAQWENTPTVPDFSVHKLRGANIARLKSRLKQMLDQLQ
jgi:hypothetical protein